MRGPERGLRSLNPVSLSSRSGANWIFDSVLNRTEGSPRWRPPSNARPCEVERLPVRGFDCCQRIACSERRSLLGRPPCAPPVHRPQPPIILGLLPLGNEIPHTYGGDPILSTGVAARSLVALLGNYYKKLITCIQKGGRPHVADRGCFDQSAELNCCARHCRLNDRLWSTWASAVLRKLTKDVRAAKSHVLCVPKT
jgi:hypothetical protein